MGATDRAWWRPREATTSRACHRKASALQHSPSLVFLWECGGHAGKWQNHLQEGGHRSHPLCTRCALNERLTSLPKPQSSRFAPRAGRGARANSADSRMTRSLVFGVCLPLSEAACLERMCAGYHTGPLPSRSFEAPGEGDQEQANEYIPVSVPGEMGVGWTGGKKTGPGGGDGGGGGYHSPGEHLFHRRFNPQRPSEKALWREEEEAEGEVGTYALTTPAPASWARAHPSALRLGDRKVPVREQPGRAKGCSGTEPRCRNKVGSRQGRARRSS